LVTGSNGQLGNELRLLAKDDTENKFYFTDINELDVCNMQAVTSYIETYKINLIINCAAFTAVDKAEAPENRMICDKLNRLAPQYLARAIENVQGSLIQISTDYVFDGESFIPYRENDKTHPMSIYGASKLAGEINAINTCSKCVVIRTAWLYSSFGNNFVKTMMKLGAERSDLGVVFDQIGTPTYARDLARAIFTIIGKGMVPGVYHFTDEGVCSWFDFAKAIHRLANITSCKVRPLHTEEYPAAAARPRYSVLDKSKIKTTYGIEIPHWEESLADCLNYMKDNKQK
jgi:dTDP-4-dehydrorhamnose reductase